MAIETDHAVDPATLLFGHDSADNAVVVDDYPYGRRVRTQIRYWVETTRHGDRFVSQTRNPRTGLWNQPKRDTYRGVMVLRRDAAGHIGRVSVTENDDAAWITAFRAAVPTHQLNDLQKRRLAQVIGYTHAMEHVSFTIVPVTGETPAQQAERHASEACAEAALCRLVAAETARAAAALD